MAVQVVVAPVVEMVGVAMAAVVMVVGTEVAATVVAVMVAEELAAVAREARAAATRCRR